MFKSKKTYIVHCNLIDNAKPIAARAQRSEKTKKQYLIQARELAVYTQSIQLPYGLPMHICLVLPARNPEGAGLSLTNDAYILL